MIKWTLDISRFGGNSLREAIYSSDETVESCIDILQRISDCICAIRPRIHTSLFEDHLSSLYNDVGEYLQEFKDDDTLLYAYAEDVVNELLSEFYDACDDCRIWIGV